MQGFAPRKIRGDTTDAAFSLFCRCPCFLGVFDQLAYAKKGASGVLLPSKADRPGSARSGTCAGAHGLDRREAILGSARHFLGKSITSTTLHLSASSMSTLIAEYRQSSQALTMNRRLNGMLCPNPVNPSYFARSVKAVDLIGLHTCADLQDIKPLSLIAPAMPCFALREDDAAPRRSQDQARPPERLTRMPSGESSP